MKEHLARLSCFPQPQNNTRNHSPIFSCPYYFLTPIIIVLVYFYFSLLPTLTLSLTILYILMRNVNVNVNLISLVLCLAARWMKVSRNPHTRTRPNQQSREREEKEERIERSANLSSLLFLLPSLPPPSAPVLPSVRPHFWFSRSQMLSLLSTSAFFFCFLFFSSIFL